MPWRTAHDPPNKATGRLCGAARRRDSISRTARELWLVRDTSCASRGGNLFARSLLPMRQVGFHYGASPNGWDPSGLYTSMA